MRVNKSNAKKTIAFTLGDLGGIGPEIYQKFLKEMDQDLFNFILVDEKFDYQNKLKTITKAKPSAQAGQHALEVLQYANQMCLAKEADYLITGPVAKESLWLAQIQVSGQTELLAQLNNLTREQIEMFFVLDEFRTVLATRHVPIKDVSLTLEQRLSAVLVNSLHALKNIFKIADPNIAVAGLNPHAGENGIIGLEENLFMKKIIGDTAKKYNANIQGCFSADALFAFAAQKFLKNEKLDFDLYVACYHDQVLPLVKGIGALRAINLTVGLPYLRLSVDHGTGYDIVDKGIASAEAFVSCVEFCKKLEEKHSLRLSK